MPPLPHRRRDGEPFDIERSEVADWLCGQPSVRQYVFDLANGYGLIEYDPDSGTWRGTAWEGSR